jgi:hypothetical protein
MKNYSTKYDLFFIHIPKNAGTSINEVLEINPYQRGHRTAMQLKNIVGYNFELSNKFCVIRNPWDRMVSLYKFRKDKGHDKHLCGDYTFEEWLYNPMTPHMPGHMDWVEQYTTIYDNQEGWLVNYILKYETLNTDWYKMLDTLKLPKLEIPLLNTSNKDDYKKYYNTKSIKFLENLFANDIKLFEYTFDNE